MPLPNDPLFNLQWHLKNTGQAGGTAGIDINVEKAWENYTGAGIRIGVYDDGVEVTHPDLVANYNAALQPTIGGGTHAGTPVNASDNHGTAVAGLIIAKGNNSLGLTGVAYDASFGTARYLGADGATATALLNQQTLYDVANHSWGTTANWFLDGPVDPGFQIGADNGRNGLGTAMLKAAGNERVGVPGGADPVGRDANDSANNSSRYITLVAAIENTGGVAEYSSPSAALLVSAPAGPLATGLSQVMTTDRSGTVGYNSGTGTPAGEPNYAAFNGTSAATPIASGVAALILQANPNLGWRDVQAIMAYSARHVGSAVGGILAGNELDSWQFNGSKTWNGGGMHFSNDYGFGLVDATTAVRLAETWLISAPAQRSINEVTTTAAITQAAQAIPDNNATGLTYTFNLTGSISIEQMALRLQLNHTAVGDLSITLTSPTGVSSDIWLRTNAATPINADWNFASREFYGEAVAGTWTVKIRDLGTLGTGTIGNLNLTAYGATLTNDTHYIYTPEFATYTRSTLSDTGGIDILDAASLMTASTIDLRAGNTSTLVGKTLVITAGTVIENAYGGDGNDGITGNTVANSLRGGRGDDTITGGGDNDTIDGGAGRDTAVWTGGRADFSIKTTVVGGVLTTTITDAVGGEGGDRTTNVETISFAGNAYGLAGIQQNLVSNMDGQRYDDVLFQNSVTGQVIYQNMTAGAGVGYQNILLGMPAGWKTFSSDDVTGDGRAEVFLHDSNTGSIYFANIASGSPVWTQVTTGFTASYQSIATGDVTRDGTPDVAIRNNATGEVFIANINPGGSFGGFIAAPNLGTGWRLVGLGDFNADGASDVLYQKIADGTTYYRDMVNNTWGVAAHAFDPSWVAKEAGDVTGDGFCDIVFQNSTTGAIWYINMAGGSGSGWGAINFGLVGWDVKGTADVDNDGWRDIIIQNTTDGTTYFADVNAGAFAGYGVVSPAIGTSWLVV